MNCKEAGFLMNLEVDGEISSQQRLHLENHISGCEECSSRQSALKDVHVALNFGVNANSPAEDMCQSVMGRVRGISPDRDNRTLLRPVIAAAAVLVVVFGSALIISRSTRGNPRRAAEVEDLVAVVVNTDQYELPDSDGSVGQAFVVSDGKMLAYNGPVDAAVYGEEDGECVLLVDAFPVVKKSEI